MEGQTDTTGGWFWVRRVSHCNRRLHELLFLQEACKTQRPPAPAAPLNLAALLIGSRGRGAEPRQGKMEWLSEQTADGGMQRQSGEKGRTV